MNLIVLGAGAWGSALANHLSKHHETTLWTRNAAHLAQIARERRNGRYLPGIPLTRALRYEADLQKALRHAADALCVIATPLAALRTVCVAIRASGCLPAHLIVACKGFENDTRQMPHQIAAEALGPALSCGVLSGPSFAREVAQGLPCALTIASRSAVCRERAVQAFHQGAMRIYATDDVIGVEVGGAVKNVLAIAAGIADGLGLGANARAALMTRGLAEMTQLGVALGARAGTLMGLSGLGDLILTATGDLSRNRTVGVQLARGQPLNAILNALGHVAEGVRCARDIRELARVHAIEMPITQAVCTVLFEGCAPDKAVKALLQRKAKAECSQTDRRLRKIFQEQSSTAVYG
ncbi:Glycerol-3-phosphate dehydrogenase (NAD(P)+) (NAD(P)H-dependent glycerol-3-phosphate dehydrogenase) [Candidatus Glomeribacter gigasporarum BEG34]|uniref:Glycerol-3-phosphate dehydrogenase [NAD(P)+] n=1 Tax=Candidatus Glomeribacter gigasporarum BEG34 TaxID=1070319 RepID=G2J898_9BURK|nr:Glycerol-3-phosphate dehydrogenase (NAD(P)+) (NAD(P)H-dependent glycerol-3-phosphate dehydrogenase) [Candidatus Glomeribacter gigasporarum BEG34]